MQYFNHFRGEAVLECTKDDEGVFRCCCRQFIDGCLLVGSNLSAGYGWSDQQENENELKEYGLTMHHALLYGKRGCQKEAVC